MLRADISLLTRLSVYVYGLYENLFYALDLFFYSRVYTAVSYVPKIVTAIFLARCSFWNNAKPRGPDLAYSKLQKPHSSHFFFFSPHLRVTTSPPSPDACSTRRRSSAATHYGAQDCAPSQNKTLGAPRSSDSEL